MLVPDEEIRALSGLKSQISDLRSRPKVLLPEPEDGVELIRYFNDAVTGLNLLYEAAAAGHQGAKSILRAEAERLIQRGTEWHDLKYSSSKK